MKEELKLTDGKCKFCQAPLEHRFVDIILLRHPDQTNISDHQQGSGYLLPTYVCANCFLVQVDESYLPVVMERAYVSSFGSTWLTDIRQFTDNIFERLENTDQSLNATLINRNDVSLSVKRDNTFSFGMNGIHELIEMYGKADTIICHDELAYVQSINDFVKGLKLFLKPEGVISMEFRHLLSVLQSNTAVTVNSECFPYLSITTLDKILSKYGLMIFDVDNNLMQGWLKISVKQASDVTKHISSKVTALRGKERSFGMSSLQCYRSFVDRLENSVPVIDELHFLSNHSL